VIEKVDDLDKLPSGASIALVGQVTGNTELFTAVIDRIRCTHSPIKVVKTMCSDSYSRQKMAAELARKAELVILLDDGGGAAQSVFEVCSRINDHVRRVGSKEEIQPEWFQGVRSTAVVGGILVPEWMIEDAAQHVRAICASPARDQAPAPV
jgi:4-hydroxy-3-methylbut-2-enyl diphosphate reductase